MASWLALLAVATVAGPVLDLGLGGASVTGRVAEATVAVAPTASPAQVDAPEAGAADPSWGTGDLSPPVSPAERPRASVAERARAGWAWPVAEPHQIVRRFGPPEVTWGSGHRGVDLAVPVGGVVRSPAEGVVTFAGVVAGQEVLVVAHADGLRSTFQPVLATAPLGAHVGRGEAVGVLTGTPGHCAPGSCVHWGVLRGAVYLDPLGLLRQQVVLLPLQ